MDPDLVSCQVGREVVHRQVGLVYGSKSRGKSKDALKRKLAFSNEICWKQTSNARIHEEKGGVYRGGFLFYRNRSKRGKKIMTQRFGSVHEAEIATFACRYSKESSAGKKMVDEMLDNELKISCGHPEALSNVKKPTMSSSCIERIRCTPNRNPNSRVMSSAS